MEYFMKSAMRKLISLCVLAMVAISPLAMAQETGTAPAITIEAAITAAVASEGSAAAAYTKLTSEEDTTLTDDQKEALAALGAEAGELFVNSVASGLSVNEAAAVVANSNPSLQSQVTTLVARIPSTNSNNLASNTDGSGQIGETAATGQGQGTGFNGAGAGAGAGTGGGAGGGGGVVSPTVP